jgi:hypothetical protein
MFQILMLGALMGILGQGARAVVGLKGMSDNAKTLNKPPSDLFDSTRLLTSLLIGFLVGLAAALIYIIKNDIKGATDAATALKDIDWHVLVGFAASGYVGVDFLEGFIAQYLPSGSPGSQKLVVDRALKLPLQATPTYSYGKAESIVLKAFNALGKPNVKDADVLSDLNYKTSSDLLGLLDAVNEQINTQNRPADVHLLSIAAIDSWKKTVGDVVTSVEYAPIA